MTEIEYRSHPAISRSELWRMHESPQKFWHAKNSPVEPTPSLLFGQVFHKLVLEPETFAEEYAVAPECDRRTKAGKQEWQEFEEASVGRIVVPAGMYDQAEAMCKALMAEPFAVKLLNGQREVEFFWADDMTSEECKCRADVLNMNFSRPIVVDLKSTEDASGDGFAKSAVTYGYDFQAAMYCDGVAKNIGQMPMFVFIAVEKKPPYAVNIFQADDLFMRRGKMLFREFLDTYHDCKVSGNWYGYMGKNNHVNTLSLPVWAARDVE